MKDSIFDEREEFMVSTIEGPNLQHPSIPFTSESDWPLKVSFDGCNGSRDVCDVLPDLPSERQLKRVENHSDAPPGFPNYPAAPPGFPNYPAAPPDFPNHSDAPPGFPNYPAVPPGFPNYPAVPPGFSAKLKQVKVETDWDACDVPPGFSPRPKKKHITEETVHTSIDYARDGSGSSSVVPPKCNRENGNENLSMEVCHTVACDVVPPGSTEKHAEGEDDRNESNRNIAHDLIDKCDDLITVIELQLSELERQVASHRRC